MKVAIIAVLVFLVIGLGSHSACAKEFSNLAGVNTNYFYSPVGPQYNAVWQLTEELDVGLLRFPGGWPSNHYDWETGIIDPKDHNEKRSPRVIRLDDFMQLVMENRLKVIYVINIFDPIEKIVRLIKTIHEKKYPVVALEIGNEVYNRRYSPLVGGVVGFLKKAVKIANAVRGASSSLPMGIPIAQECVPGKEQRKVLQKWNHDLSRQDLSMFQAVILHYYINIKKLNSFNNAYKVASEGVQNCAESISKQFPKKEIWVTEWNLAESPRTKYNNSMIHALFVSRILLGFLMENNVTVSCYHALDGWKWGLFEPTPSLFKYSGNMAKNDDLFHNSRIPLVRHIPYYALQMIFQLINDSRDKIKVENYAKYDIYGNLPVDVLKFGDGKTHYLIVINPNDRSISIEDLLQKSDNFNPIVKVLAARRNAVNSISGNSPRNTIAVEEAVVPKSIASSQIEPVSLSVFNIGG